ncbi:Hsp20 family protein [Staphylococcus aureus]
MKLPQHAKPENVKARYVNGCLTISVGKREASRLKAITVQ